MRHLLRASVLGLLGTTVLSTPAFGAQVRGSVVSPPSQVSEPRTGYTETRVASPAKDASAPASVAVFMRSKESLPIPAARKHMEIAIEGLRFTPQIATCAVDGKVIFENRDPEPVTVKVGETEVGPISPGDTAEYVCTAGEPEELRPVRIENWRHCFAAIFVGPSGVAARPNPRGYFVLSAPQGTYELQLITVEGIQYREAVEITRLDVDLGRIDLTDAAGSDSSSQQ